MNVKKMRSFLLSDRKLFGEESSSSQAMAMYPRATQETLKGEVRAKQGTKPTPAGEHRKVRAQMQCC